MRTIDSAPLVNQKLPSGPNTMLLPCPMEETPVGSGYSPVTCPAVVMRPTLPISRNARPDDLSDAMATGNAELVMMVLRVMVPVGVIELIRFPMNSVNQILPSGPAVRRSGSLAVAAAKSVETPAGVMRPTLLLVTSVYQMLPSGPAARKVTVDLVLPTMIGNSPIMVPVMSHLPILLRLVSANQRKPPSETMS